ncbi:FAD:protein FMN transferase [Gammaproteobacteria bacterium]
MAVMLSRRRFITLVGATVGLPLLSRVGSVEAKPLRWEGIALGAPASIQLYHADETRARAALAVSLNELKRLEAIFSVHRADSSISALNREGKLENAPDDLITMLKRALALAEITNGVYDPTIQPVWQLYFRHFTAARPDPTGPAPRDLAAALTLVDWRAVELDTQRRRIAFARPGMGLTLNSGAQGYITDRITDTLRAHGFDRMLVDMGEPRALSLKPDGSAWRIGIANPAAPNQAITTLEIVNKCVATSGGYGTVFDENGTFTHLINTRTGQTAPALFGVSVVADSGIQADGLSTAMLMAPVEQRRAILKAGGGLQAIYITPEGVIATVDA